MLNVGVIGAGRMGSFHALHLSNRIAGARLFALADQKPEVREALGRDLDIDPSRVFEKWEDLMALDGLDAVVVTVPTRQHGIVVRAAAARGVAVFCSVSRASYSLVMR